MIECHLTVNHVIVLPVHEYEEIASHAQRRNGHNVSKRLANAKLSMIHLQSTRSCLKFYILDQLCFCYLILISSIIILHLIQFIIDDGCTKPVSQCNMLYTTLVCGSVVSQTVSSTPQTWWIDCWCAVMQYILDK